MSLNENVARWYLIVQHNTTYSQATVAAETSGSIVGRLRIVWIYEYGTRLDLCNGIEGPLILLDRNWLIVTNTTGIVIIRDNGDSAILEHRINVPRLCANDMAYSEADEILLLIDKLTFNIIRLNISTKNVSFISLTDICQVKII